MYTMNKPARGFKVKGFTLFELLVALTISALVAAGLFSIFSSVASVRQTSVTKSENTLIIQSITKLLNRDARMMMAGSLGLDSSEDIRKLKLTTQNSLRFNKSLPVEIIYYIEDGWLIRRETNTDVLYDMDMKLIPEVTDMKIEFYNGNEYQEELISSAKLFKIILTINGSEAPIIMTRTVENS